MGHVVYTIPLGPAVWGEKAFTVTVQLEGEDELVKLDVVATTPADARATASLELQRSINDNWAITDVMEHAGWW